MTLRLVLVSLVAAMGLTIPSAPVIESWVASTQNWMNARFADWDTRNPQTADYVIVSDYYDVERLAPRPAISSLPANAPEPSDRPGPPTASSAAFSSKPASFEGTGSIVRPVSFVKQEKSFEPTWVGEQLSLGIAYELNLENEGIGVLPPPVVKKPVAVVRFDPKPVVDKVSREVKYLLAQWTRTMDLILPRLVFPAASPRRIEPVVAAKKPGDGVVDKVIQQNRGVGINPAVAIAARPVPTKPTTPIVAIAAHAVAIKPVTPAGTIAAKPVVTKPATPAVAIAAKSVATKPVTPVVVIVAKPVATKPAAPVVAIVARPVVTKPAPAALAIAARPVITKPTPAALPVAVRRVVTKPVTPAVASRSSFGPMETSTSLYFAGALTPAAKAIVPAPRKEPSKPPAAPVAVRPLLSPRATETRELPDELDIEEAGELVGQDDGFAAPAKAAKAPIAAATPRYEPLEVSCEYYVGTAFELNFRNDGLSLPVEAAVKTAKTDVPAPHSGRDLSRAVKLTRDAVYAWVNVLTGPALVTWSQSN